MNHAQCPLCGGPAKYRSVSAPDGKRFECPVCTQFFIDEPSENYLSGLPEIAQSEHRQLLSKKARETGDGRLFVIRHATPEEAHTGIAGQTRELIAEYVKT